MNPYTLSIGFLGLVALAIGLALWAALRPAKPCPTAGPADPTSEVQAWIQRRAEGVPGPSASGLRPPAPPPTPARRRTDRPMRTAHDPLHQADVDYHQRVRALPDVTAQALIAGDSSGVTVGGSWAEPSPPPPPVYQAPSPPPPPSYEPTPTWTDNSPSSGGDFGAGGGW